MNENVKAFLETVKDDPELREKLTRMSAGEIAAVAKERGIELTDEDFKAPSNEVGEEDLANVAGGIDGSICPVIGGAIGTDSRDGNGYLCICAVYGQGGDGSITDGNCACFLTGHGDVDRYWWEWIDDLLA